MVANGMLPEWEIVARLGAAAVLGSLVGIERERQAWAAGLRTHMLVSVGACLTMIVSAFGFSDVLGTPHVDLDPSRIAAQVVSGIGFIGGGCILLRGDIVRGLTTAASLWTVAAVGLAVGGGLYIAAGSATALILGILVGLKPLEEWVQYRNKSYEIVIKVVRQSTSLQTINDALGYRARRIVRFVANPLSEEVDEIRLTLTRLPASDLSEILSVLGRLPTILEVAEAKV